MPVEIKELVIRATIDAPSDNRPQAEESSSALDAGQIQAIIQACVEEVMKQMDRKESR